MHHLILGDTVAGRTEEHGIADCCKRGYCTIGSSMTEQCRLAHYTEVRDVLFQP